MLEKQTLGVPLLAFGLVLGATAVGLGDTFATPLPLKYSEPRVSQSGPW